MVEQLYLNNKLEKIFSDIQNQNYSSALEEAAGLVAIANLKGKLRDILLGKYLMAIAYYNMYEYKLSIDKYLEITNTILNDEVNLDDLNLHQDFFDQVRYGLAISMYNLGDLEGSTIIVEHIIKNAQNRELVLDAIILLGVIYIKMYELQEKLIYIVTPLEMYLNLLEQESLARQKKIMIFNNLSILFSRQGEYQKSQEMLNNSIILANCPEEMVFIYNEMARINLKLNKLDKTQKNLEKAEEYLRNCINPGEVGYHFYIKGMYFCEMEKYSEAQMLLEKSLYLAKKTNSLLNQIQIYKELTILYEKMGYDSKSEYFSEYNKLKEGIIPVKNCIEVNDILQILSLKGLDK